MTNTFPKWRLSENRKPVATQIQLILSDLCNHDCTFCAYRLSGYTSNQNFDKTLQMPTEKAREIIAHACGLGVRGIQFTGGGEPTVHPQHLSLMLSAQNFGMKTSLVTNGNILRHGWESIFKAMSWVRVSVDAGSAYDYVKIRKVKASAWDRLWANITKMAQAGVPNLGTSFIVTKDNLNGIFNAAILAREAGASYFRVGAFFNPQMRDYYSMQDLDIIGSQLRQCAAFKGFPKGFFFDQFTKRLDYMSRKPTFSFCGYQHRNWYIGADQKVYRCCEYAYNDHGFVGDLREQTLTAWHVSQKAEAARRCFDAMKCVTCPFHTKNELIEFMTRGDISEMHPEFP